MPGVRIHGSAPHRVAVLHGGPGARGSVEPVARVLAEKRGVLEPFQRGATLDEQVAELRTQLDRWADLPVTLIGHSWGAWLGWLLAGQCPSMVAKLVLVSSGAFVACYAEGLTDARKARLTAEESAEVDAILAQMTGEPASGPGADARLTRLGQLMSRADGYKVLPESTATRVECDMRVFQGVWPEAAALRESGQLLALGRHITCPVVAIHGDFDPSPANGVRVPLSSVLADFRFILLERCGHSPWEERWAAGEFFRVLDRILE